MGEFAIAEGVAVGVAVQADVPIEPGQAGGHARVGIGCMGADDAVKLSVKWFRVDLF